MDDRNRTDRQKRRQGSGKPARQDMSDRPENERAQGERIAKRLARAGVASRREAETMIAAGRIRVNGRVLDTPAVTVAPGDAIEIDGAPVPAIERTRLFLFYKPAGTVTSNRDPQGRKTVFDVLPEDLPRLVTVGRLDYNTEGLLLLTNDGGLARVLELPSTAWLRRYRVRVHGAVDEAALAGLKDGIAVAGVFYGAIEATLDRRQGTNAWLTIGLREGKNREVRAVLGALGLEVNRLIRVSYGPFQLGDLAEGAVREIRGRTLRDQLGERLIAEAGARFDIPVTPARDQAAAPKNEPRRQAPRQGDKSRQDRRQDALDRLHTKPKSAPAGKPARAGAPEPHRSRASNVWMAPGAKPMGEKKRAAEEERTRDRRYAGKPRPAAGRKPKPGIGSDSGPDAKSPGKPGANPRSSRSRDGVGPGSGRGGKPPKKR